MGVTCRFRTLAVLLSLLAAVIPARALQLGETRAEVVAKHGAPGTEDRGRKLAIYFWDGWSAQLEFRADTVRKLTYRRAESLQDTDLLSLLHSNGGVTHWREVTQLDAPARQWRRNDGATAECAAEHPTSIVFESAKAVVAVFAPSSIPTVMTPGAPAPASSTPSKYPKMLDALEEPSLASETVITSEKPVVRPLPKLPSSEIGVPSSAVLPDDLPSLEPPPASKNGPNVLSTEERESASPEKTPSHSFGGLAIAALMAGLVAIGGWVFWQQRRKPPVITSAGIHPRHISRRKEARPAHLLEASALDRLRPDQHDLIIGEIFRREGYRVDLSGAVAQDDHIDLTLRRDSDSILVQSKHWSMPQIGEAELRDFYNAMAAAGAPRGIFVTTGTFNREARVYAVSQGIELMDRPALEESAAAVTRPGEDFWNVPGWIDEFAAQARIFDPECPLCQGAMVVRSNRATGVPSWACRQLPRCPGKREARVDLIAAMTGR